MKACEFAVVVIALEGLYTKNGDTQTASDLAAFANLLTRAGDMKLPKFASIVMNIGKSSDDAAAKQPSTRRRKN
jgi:hypothetical protein